MKYFFTLLFSAFFVSSFLAQDEDESGANLKIGVNVGGYFANDSSAFLYNGYYTNYGISYIFNNPYYKTELTNYFQYSYSLYSLPQNTVYRPALNVGLHLAIDNNGSAGYMDVNFAQLEIQDQFTVAIDDPNNNSPEPTYEQIPLFGHEKRFNLNLGYRAQFYKQDELGVYWPIFANLNSVQLVDNYIVINNKKYPINHVVPNQPNVKQNGIGFGGRTGLGSTYQFNHKFTFDLSYNLTYTKTHYDDVINYFGFNNSLMFRIIWG